MTACPRCGLTFSEPSVIPSACPNCGERIESRGTSVSASSTQWITDYFRTLWMILTQPTRFFKAMPVRGGVSSPLAFALVTHWLGSAAAYLWHLLIGGAIGGLFERIFKVAGDVVEVDHPGRNAQLMEMADRVKHWLWGAGAVIADPFSTLLWILFISFWVFLGARLLVTPGKNGAPGEISYESALRLVCYGLAPSILGVLPLFGWLISNLYTATVTIIGARETYRVNTGRATVIALFPEFLMLSLLGIFLFAMILVMIKLFATTF